RYPADSLSQTRAKAALDLWDRPSASLLPAEEQHARIESFEEQLVERLDAEAALRRSRLHLVPTSAPAGSLPATAGTRRSQTAAVRSVRRRTAVSKTTPEAGGSRGAS